jgi:hypothetical protein
MVEQKALRILRSCSALKSSPRPPRGLAYPSPRSKGILRSMAELQPIAGYIVRVTTARLGGGEPSHVPYVVAEGDPAKAEQLIRRIMTADEQVTAIYPLPASAVEAFGLEPGQFTHAH